MQHVRKSPLFLFLTFYLTYICVGRTGVLPGPTLALHLSPEGLVSSPAFPGPYAAALWRSTAAPEATPDRRC